ncbi:uncharacterized protein A1O5_11157 [Cladophialophora psammophila CBS 110553]|uniref:Chromatin modification-related protein EAF3 n=1 Tax=Cladophialophora psammophila CBS 110553 TaxID=1182543 RepID=W9WKV9_9EURO|nr:uncharacterized protein A1O5_11157 [Cladophialophora psammophila CBS 110553]EXJ65630.1 hypothetical protein A1O5_11157 [Cladophialophora psammophila CBS 110553]
MAPQTNDNKPMYAKDEKALCFHGELLYDAKITDVKKTDPKETKSPYHYKVHYKGWKNTWDDWVPQDRLRKNTEENRELAANLRQQAALKAGPKVTGKTRRGQGSEIGSGRGSEERTSSVPAAGGRGSKRTRDNDLEKVGGDFPSHKRTRTRVFHSRDDDNVPRLNMMSWTAGSPKDKDLEKASAKDIPAPNLDTKDDDDDLDEPPIADDEEEVEPSPSLERQSNDPVDLRQFLYVPRKAAVKATNALANTNWNKASVATSPARKKKTTRQNPPKSSNAATKEKTIAATSSNHNLSAGVSNNQLSTSKAAKSSTNDADVVGGKRSANVGKKSGATQGQPKVLQYSDYGRSKAHSLPYRTAGSSRVRNNKVLSSLELGDEEIADAEDEESEDDVVTSVRRSVQTAAAVSDAKSKSVAKRNNEGRRSQQITQSPSGFAKSPRTLRSSITTTPAPRQLRSCTDAMTPKQPLRPWNIKDTTNYTPADIDRLLAQPAPKDGPEFLSHSSWEKRTTFHAPLISGTTYLEEEAIDEELRSARKDAAPAGGAPGQPLEVDPPGSSTPFDALKFPYRLIEKINRDGDRFPAGWTEENLMCIPDHCAVWIREELLVKLPFSALEGRPPWVLKEVPDYAPFWEQYERENEAEIINAFAARARMRCNGDDHALLDLAIAAGDRAFESAAQASRSIGTATFNDFRTEGCRMCATHGVSCDGVTPDPGPRTQDSGRGFGFSPASRRGQHPVLQFARIAQFPTRDFDLEQGICTYLTMHSQEDAFYLRPSIRINVPDHLKNLLVDDWENVTKSLLLVPLPSQAPANYIIDEYFNAEKMNRRLCSPEADILEEFCAGLKMYFEKAVGKILLYRFERSQLAEVRKLWESGRYKEWEGKGPGDCYGAEHLTRMIVNLPEMIAQTNMDAEAVSRLKTELSKFSTWLSRNSAKYFCAKYEKPSAEYIENAR